MSNSIANNIVPSELVEEYEAKTNGLSELYDNFMSAKRSLESGCVIFGGFGENIWRGYSNGEPDTSAMQRSLLKSAWGRIYHQWVKSVATAKDKCKIETMLENPPEFNMENIKEQFGDYVLDPWASILRGLAEVFCDLDPFYKSHTKVKIGADKLPKRIIVSGFDFPRSSGMNKLTDIVNAIRAYRREPLTTYKEIDEWIKAADREDKPCFADITSKIKDTMNRTDDLYLRTFQNGNGHIFFCKSALHDINKALSDFYGEVLPDVDLKSEKKRASTEVSKDLQYYPTPKRIAEKIVSRLCIPDNSKILEPSCGCGRILDAIPQHIKGVVGIEYDATKANQARANGHNVRIANFLELEPVPGFDFVIMNPPFYGKHYLKHIEAAIKWLRPNGTLVSILPSSARYDHGIIDKEWLSEKGMRCGYDLWRDLPVGSFCQSGTNVNTTILKMFNNDGAGTGS